MAFSVIVPVYNAKEYLRECIESVLNQTYADFELVLVDDGSKDGSGEICDEYAGKDTRVKVFHEPNMGQLHSREYGIARSSNEWLLFLDADDYLEKTALEVISGKIGRYACDCVVFGFRKFKGDQTLAVVTEDRKEYPTDSTRELFRTLLFEPVYNAIWRKAVNKSCFDSRDYSGFYHLRLAEDRLQSAEIFSNAKKVLFIDDVLYNYRVNEAGITRNPSLDMLSSLAAEEEILRIIRQKSIFSPDDMIEYRTVVVKNISEKVWIIAGLKETRQKRIKAFEKIKQSGLYKDFVLAGRYHKPGAGPKHIFFLLFKHNLYSMIFLLAKSFGVFRKVFLANRI